MADRKRGSAYQAGYRAGRTLAGVMVRVLRKMTKPVAGSVLEEIAEAIASDAECEDEDIPDCGSCKSHGKCPFESKTIHNYEVPPGYVLVYRGYPDPLSWN